MNPVNPPYNQGLSSRARIFLKQSDIQAPLPPSKCWVLLDENHRSINDGWFVVAISGYTWVDVPASYHNGAGGISYADGHAEIKKWRDQRLLRATSVNTPADPTVPPVPPGYGDLKWMQERSSVPMP